VHFLCSLQYQQDYNGTQMPPRHQAFVKIKNNIRQLETQRQSDSLALWVGWVRQLTVIWEPTQDWTLAIHSLS